MLFQVNLIRRQFLPHRITKQKHSSQFRLPLRMYSYVTSALQCQSERPFSNICIPAASFPSRSPLDLFPPAFSFYLLPLAPEPPAYLPTFGRYSLRTPFPIKHWVPLPVIELFWMFARHICVNKECLTQPSRTALLLSCCGTYDVFSRFDSRRSFHLMFRGTYLFFILLSRDSEV